MRLRATGVAVVLAGTAAASVLAPPAAAAAAPTISGPASAARGTLVRLTGSAPPWSRVDVFFRRQGTAAYADRRDLIANGSGRFRTVFRADVDYHYYAVARGRASGVVRVTKAVGTTLIAPVRARRGTTVLLTGRASPSLRVDVLFRAAGSSTFVDRRDLRTDRAGWWRTRYRAVRDYEIVARTAEGSSRHRTVRLAYATIRGPRTVRAGSTVVLTGTAHPRSAVGVWFRRAGTTRFVQRRTLRVSAAGRFRTSYRAGASYAYYAIADGVRSAIVATHLARTTAAGVAPTAAERRVVALVNARRAAAGCPALRIDSRLTAAARRHSTDMARRRYFAHVSPEGWTPSRRAAAAGYPGGAGENIAAGYGTADSAVAGWMGSTGHRANILSCGYRRTGVGYGRGGPYGSYWTQMFGSR